MDQNKNTQAQPTQGHQGQQRPDREQGTNTGTRDQAEGSREKTRGGQSGMGEERGTGRQGERNSSSMGSKTSSRTSGISNRGMSSSDEQADLPSRGSGSMGDDDSLDQSER